MQLFLLIIDIFMALLVSCFYFLKLYSLNCSFISFYVCNVVLFLWEMLCLIILCMLWHVITANISQCTKKVQFFSAQIFKLFSKHWQFNSVKCRYNLITGWGIYTRALFPPGVIINSTDFEFRWKFWIFDISKYMKYAEEKHSNKCCTHFNRIDYKCPIVLKISINHTGLFDTFLPITENARIMIRYTFCDNIVFMEFIGTHHIVVVWKEDLYELTE